MSLGKLEVLKEHRQTLLLAEVAAWLHDVGKFCNLHIEAHTADGSKKWANDHAYKAIVDAPDSQIHLSSQANSVKKPDALNNILKAGSPKAADFLSSELKNFLTSNCLTILDETYTLAELIMLGTPGFATDKNRASLLNGKNGGLAAMLGVCHNEAHVDKQDPARDEGMQTWPHVYVSDAFGFEGKQVVVDASPDSLNARLENLKIDRKTILNELSHGLGDTRQPVNEVTLSDWGSIVAALFKSALAGVLIRNQQYEIGQWKSWKNKIIDHNLRWRVLRVNFDALALYAKAVKISDLLAYQNAVDDACEEIKRLVEEEYPLGNEIYRDTSGIYFTFPDLDLPAELEQEIRRRVEEVEPELAPRIAVTVGAGATAQDQLKNMLGKARGEAQKDLAQPFDARNLNSRWQQEWEDVGAGQWEVCPVCRLRPKRESAEACQHCQQRRQSRLDVWKKHPANTIWMGEVADANDRVALLVGKFGLDDWLSGALVQTMLVSASENNPAECVSKNASPARLRRVWETCQRFWEQTVQQDILTAQSGSSVRKLITPSRNNWKEQLYNGKVNGKPLDLFWMPEQEAFLTVSSLQAAGDLVKGANVILEDPDATKQVGEFQIQSIQDAPEPYRHYQPSLALHASPDQFLAFVPADRALRVIEQIRTQYERQFGKVRNRLPLALGAIFCERKMPLQAVLDAARQIFTRPIVEERWNISKADGNGRLEFDNGVCWDVPTLMGDGKTEDVWYPYVKLADAPAAHHVLRFEQGGAQTSHWTHVKTLQRGDSVCLTPSTFDFLWLDTAARRFEAHYDESGRRPARPSRPYYLEEFARLEASWKRFSHLSRSQMKQTLQAIEEARQRWFGRDKDNRSANDQTFCKFVKDVLANAQWDWRSIPQPERDALTKAGARGALNDLAELHLEILKEKSEGANS